MLRRLVLTAAASVAALASALPAAPASADPLPLPLPPLLQGSGAVVEEDEQESELTVTTADTGNVRTSGQYELACGPAGGKGSHPLPQGACDRLDKLAQEGKNPFAPVPEDQMCTQQYGGDATAHIVGTWRGQPVDAHFSLKNGCEISRWETLVPVLPKTRS
ncbi:SSI family serine proteinase inhibitor [Streptomyces sp. NPDC051907]|uniref:SSI family serine proteinase inhibitor n=1 Tax=Streptomyces sp. NPDC051907 TaxID=3155284 RepID=UPI0034412383